MIKNKKFFITGGAGFIASKIINHYIKNNKIVIYDNFTRNTLKYSKYKKNKNLKIISGDVLDFEHLKKSMQGSEIVIHAAGIAGIESVVKDPVKTMKVNMLGTANALEAAKECNINTRFINFSTSEVFGPMSFKSNEHGSTVAGTAGEARWTYAVSKLAGEHLALAYYRKYKLPIVSIRPFNIYGPGQTGEGAIKIFTMNALKNKSLNIDGDGSQIRAWCYVDDFIEGLIKAIEVKKAIGNTINIGNQRAVITILGLAQTVCRVLKSKSKIIFKPPLSADVELRIPSTKNSEKLLGFKAKIDLDEGIIKTSKWLKKIYDL